MIWVEESGDATALNMVTSALVVTRSAHMSDLLIGILLSIPIGIATSLITPWIQGKLDQLNKYRSLAATKRLDDEYRRVLLFRNNPHEFTQYLVQVAIQTAFTSAFVGIIAGLIYAIAQATVAIPSGMGGAMNFDEINFIRTSLFVFGQFVTLLGSLLIMNICRPALSVRAKLQNFDEYSKSVEALRTR